MVFNGEALLGLLFVHVLVLFAKFGELVVENEGRQLIGQRPVLDSWVKEAGECFGC